VIIGGGLSLAFNYFKDPLIDTIKRNYYSKTDPVFVESTTLGYDGAFLGAAALALRGLKNSI
jgi:hypothetical protein